MQQTLNPRWGEGCSRDTLGGFAFLVDSVLYNRVCPEGELLHVEDVLCNLSVFCPVLHGNKP